MTAVRPGFAARFRARPHASAAVVVAVLLLAPELFPHRMPFGIALTGAVFGVWTGLVALSVVLVFRSNRLVSFAAYAFGGAAVVLWSQVLRHHALATLLTGRSRDFPGWALTVQYWGGAALALLLAVLLSVVAFAGVVRRLTGTPPLVGTVATIAISALLAAGSRYVLLHAFAEADLAGQTAPPQDLTWRVGPAILHAPQIATLFIGVLVLPCLELLLRRTRLGTGVRAAAANPERAATLGVSGATLSAVVWAIAGGLSGLAALLTVAATGPGDVGGPSAFVQVLAAVVLGGTVSLRVAFAAGVATGVLQQGLLWSFHRGELGPPVLLGVVLIWLLVLRRSPDRVDLTASAWQASREVRPTPAVLRALPEVRRLRRRGAVLLALAVVAYPFLVPSAGVETGTFVLVEAIVGTSVLVITGWAGLISLGQFALAGVGAWVTAVLAGQHHVPALLALPVGALTAGAVAALIGLPALRIRGLYLAIVSLSAAVTVTTLLIDPRYGGRALPGSLSRPRVLGFSTDDERAFFFLCLVATALCLGAVAGLRRSRAARALIASRDNERAAELFGVDIVRARLAAFVLSGVLAGLGGGLLAFQQRSVDAGTFGPSASILVFLVVVVGGFASLAGPVLGAIVLGTLSFVPQSELGAFGLPVAVLVVLLAAPGGLTQGVFAGRDALLRRIATRRRLAIPGLVGPEHPSWRGDRLIPLAPSTAAVPARYALTRQPLTVELVAATGKGS